MRSLNNTRFIALLVVQAFAVSAALPLVAHAQAPVVYVVNGRLYNQDFFGGGGTLEEVLPTTTGDTLNFSQSLVHQTGFSETTLSYNGAVSGNMGTFSANFTSLVQRGYTADFQFFIYSNSSEITVDTYVLGGAGTPYQFSVTSTGFNNSVDSGAGSATAAAGSEGRNYPGLLYTHPTTGGTFSTSGVSSSELITYLGNTYSRISPGPSGQSSASFGITGNPQSNGFTSMDIGHSFTYTVTNLAVASAAAPEASSLPLLSLGLLGITGLFGAIQRRTSRKSR